MIEQHLPVLQVAVPIVAAPICLLIRKRQIVQWVALAVCWCAFAISIALLKGVVSDGPISYDLGGWQAPYGIEYRVDLLRKAHSHSGLARCSRAREKPALVGERWKSSWFVRHEA